MAAMLSTPKKIFILVPLFLITASAILFAAYKLYAIQAAKMYIGYKIQITSYYEKPFQRFDFYLDNGQRVSEMKFIANTPQTGMRGVIEGSYLGRGYITYVMAGEDFGTEGIAIDGIPPGTEKTINMIISADGTVSIEQGEPYRLRMGTKSLGP